MNKLNYENIKDILDLYISDVSKAPPKAKHYVSASESVVVDISEFDYISLNNLVNIYLIIDYIQASVAPVILRMPGLVNFDTNLFMKIDDYNSVRKKQNGLPNNERDPRFVYSDPKYRFLSFCHNYGFFDALEWQRGLKKVTIEGLKSDLLSKLHHFSSTRKSGSTILHIKKISAVNELESFRISNNIKNWLKSLPLEIIKAPIFTDGEFSHIFAYQLGLNILEHAGSAWVGDGGANGVIAMRVLEKSKFWQIKSDIPEQSQLLNDTKMEYLLEICVGDRGNGIVNSLRDAYESYTSKYGLNCSLNADDIIAFAFDEIGTRKSIGERLSGVHALHRILKCTIKYGGILKLTTSGSEYIYDSTIENSIKRGEVGVGIYPSYKNNKSHPYGAQYQILIPINDYPKQHKPVKRYNTGLAHKSVSSKLRYKVVDANIYITSDDSADSQLDISILRQNLMEEPQDVIVVFDFGGCNTDEDKIIVFFNALHHVLQSRLCIGIDLDSNIAKSLRGRELLNINIPEIEDYRRDLFYELSVSNRLLMCVDCNKQIWWYGLGAEPLDDHFSEYFKSINKLSIEISSIPSDKYKSIITYLNSNSELFDCSISGTLINIKCNITESDIDSILGLVVRNKIDIIINELRCLEAKGYYKIPSTNEIYTSFIQSAPLLQFESIAYQVSNWMAFAVKALINESKTVLFLSITAPAELLAKSISNSLISVQAYVYNLGYHSALDEEMLFNSEDWENIPTIIIADIVNSKKSINQLVEFTDKKKLQLKGFVSLIKLIETTNVKNPRSLYWNPPPNNDANKLPMFFVAEYNKPLKAKSSEIELITEDNYYFVEPHSLEVFSKKSLSGHYDINSAKGIINQNKLTQLEEANVLRFGHWISGTHHFMITTSISNILNDSILGSNVCSDVLDKMLRSDIDIVLMPLHSHISDIIPRLATAVKLASSKTIVFNLCLSTKAMATNSFYVLPKPVKDIIDRHADNMTNAQIPKLNIMILDDAIATGRTLVTIVRAIILNIRKVVNTHKLTTSPIGLIHSYSIIDRQGRAKSTFMTGITKLSCKGDGEWESEHEIDVNFKHDRWLDVDMPVYDSDSCKICNERNQLLSLKSSSLISMDHSAVYEINKRIHELRPQSSEIPAFHNMNKLKLLAPVRIGKNNEEANSVELALWEIHNLLHRGASFDTLIEEYNTLYLTYPAEIAENEAEENQQRLIIEFLRIITREWNKLNCQFEGKTWINSLKKHIDYGGVIAKVALWEAGKALATSNNEYIDLLLSLYSYSLSKLASFDHNKDPQGEKRDNLFIGIILFILSNNYMENMKGDITTKLLKYVNAIDQSKLEILTRIYLDEIVSCLYRTSNRDNFMPALMSVLNQTIRPGRHNHDHLLPSLLSSILKNKAEQNEIRLVRDILADFLYCIDIIDRRYFSLFDDSARLALPFYRKTIEQAITEMSNHDCNIITNNAKSLISKLYRHSTHQPHNPIYQSLRRTQVSIKHIMDLISSKCIKREPSILLLLDKTCSDVENVNLIAPNIKIIEELVSNFTVNSSIIMRNNITPKLFVKIVYPKDVEAIGKVQLHIYTNYSDDTNCINNILNGPGIKEANTRTLELFRIKVYPTEDSNGEYNMHIIMELCIGYPL